MILHHLHAENILSFGTGDQALDIDFHQGLNVFVGPNGGGKSNILRVLGILLAYFRKGNGFPSSSPAPPPHKPEIPNAHIRLECRVEWNTPAEQDLWTAFLIGALVPRREWQFSSILDPEMPAEQWPFDGDRLNRYLTAVSQLDFRPAVASMIHQTLVVEIDPRTRRHELTCRLPRLRAAYEITRGGYLHCAESPPPGPRVSLADLYVRTLPPSTKAQWSEFWKGQGDLPTLPAFDWSCLAGLRDGEAVALNPFEGSYQADLTWPRPVWPLLKIDPSMDSNSNRVRWESMVAHLLQDSYMRWDRWGIQDPAPWTHGTPLVHYLQDGALGPALLALTTAGHEGQVAYQALRADFQRLTGTALAYRIPDPPPPTLAPTIAPGRNGQGVRRTRDPQGSDPPPMLVEAVTTEDIPIRDAGSGRAQIALLLLMLQRRGAVLALDEPEQALHPILQAQLAQQWVDTAAQTLMVTHSPYLLPPGRLDRVRYVARNPDTGCSQVSPRLLTGNDNEAAAGVQVSQRGAALNTEGCSQRGQQPKPLAPETLARHLRQAGDGLWLFARVVVLVEGPDDAAALSVWFDKWVAARPMEPNRPNSAHALGVLFWPAGGNKAIMPFARILDRFAIPWVALFDADTLAKTGEIKGDRVESNHTVWQSWGASGYLGVVPKQFESLAWAERFSHFPLSRRGNSPQVFLRGTESTDNLDTLREVKQHKTAAKAVVDQGPNMYRWIAEQTPCPAEFKKIFEAVYQKCGA